MISFMDLRRRNLTKLLISDTKRRMGRPPLNVVPILTRVAEGVPERIDALVGKHRRAEFIREAIEKELKRREQKSSAVAALNR